MKLFFSLIACLCTLVAYGQYSLRPNLYFQNPAMNYYNPSASLNSDSLRHSFLLYGKYSVVDSEVWNKPATVFANYTGSFRRNNGFFSVGYIRDKYSFFTRQSLYAGYTRQVKVLKKRTLSYGLRGVFNLDRIRWEQFPSAGTTGTDTRFLPDLDLGLQYQGKHLMLGIASKNVFSSQTKYEGETLLKNPREWIVNLSYAIYFGKKFIIAPMAMLYSERKTDLDLGVNLSLYRQIHLTYLFRVRQLRSIYGLEMNLVRGLHIGFSVDNSIIYNDNNLDFVLGYRF